MAERIESYRAVTLDPGAHRDIPPPGVMLVTTLDDGTPEYAHFACPCGCDDILGANLIPQKRVGGTSCWTLTAPNDKPTLDPSVRVVGGCQSHFYIRDGLVIWYEN